MVQQLHYIKYQIKVSINSNNKERQHFLLFYLLLLHKTLVLNDMYIMIGNNQIKEIDINIDDINPENITLNKKPYRYIFTYYIAYEASNAVNPLFIF